MNPRSVFISGASQGIGAAIAQHFIDLGDKVATASPSGKSVPKALALTMDLADSASVADAIAQARAAHGEIEILVANAGIILDELAIKMPEADWVKVIDVNLNGSYRLVKEVLPSMLAARSGSLVFIGSIIGATGGFGQINYASAKAGLVGLAKSLAKEYGARGIRSNLVAPGFIETEMTAHLPDKIKEKYLSQIPLGRMGTPVEVAQVVGFLAGKSASYVNGAVLPVTGGLGMGI